MDHDVNYYLRDYYKNRWILPVGHIKNFGLFSKSSGGKGHDKLEFYEDISDFE